MAKQTTLSLSTFAKQAVKDYFRSYLFTVLIYDPKTDNSSTSFRCEWVAKTSTPVSTTTVQNIDWMHSQIKQSGRTTVGQWSVDVRDDAQNKAYEYFQFWRDQIYNLAPKISSNPAPSTTIPDRYKKNALIHMFMPSSLNADKSGDRTYVLEGIWPMEIGSIGLDYDAEGISIFSVTLSIDLFYRRRYTTGT